MDNLLSSEQIKLEVCGGGDDASQRIHLINGRLISVDSDASHLLESFTSDADLGNIHNQLIDQISDSGASHLMGSSLTDADLGLSSQQDVLSSVYTDVQEEVTSMLDEDMFRIDSNGIISHLMDIRTSLLILRAKLELKLGTNLSDYEFWLQDSKKLEINKTLVDQCINRIGPVQVSIQIRSNQKRINIVDVLKPDEDFMNVASNRFEFKTQEQQAAEIMPTSKDPLQIEESLSPIRNTDENSQSEESLPAGSMAKWIVDENFRADQKRLQIPQDPKLWTVMQVRHWIQWAVRQFKLTGIKLSDWSISGKDLCALSLHAFKKKCPSDPGDLFWTHLELMKKCGVVAIMQTDDEMMEILEPINKTPSAIKKKPKVTSSMNKVSNNHPVTLMTAGVNRNGNNGQIQLWQFLLELLTSTEHTSVIQWIGSSGEFKLQEPGVVACLWGKRKHKPTMNYEKLSRALRYYYDGDMISKVHGKRFVYRFVCDLKQLIGYDAGELAQLVNKGLPADQTEMISW